MRRYVPWIALGVGLGLLLAAAISWNRPYTLRGSVVQEPYAAPDFSLPDGKGGQFQLSAERGKMVLIFFGYTSCPDICPTTLADLKQVRQRLGKDADKVQVVFITVDPGRDTPERTAKYVSAFDPSFTGLSGSEQQLEPVWKDYGVYHQLNKQSPNDTVYSVDHSTQVYLVDEKGNLRLTYSYGTPVDDILLDIRYLLKQG